jgi:hypothetical protein
VREYAKTADSRRVDASVRMVAGMLGFHAAFKSAGTIDLHSSGILTTNGEKTYKSCVVILCFLRSYFI